jgi:hypothetical protein
MVTSGQDIMQEELPPILRPVRAQVLEVTEVYRAGAVES